MAFNSSPCFPEIAGRCEDPRLAPRRDGYQRDPPWPFDSSSFPRRGDVSRVSHEKRDYCCLPPRGAPTLRNPSAKPSPWEPYLTPGFEIQNVLRPG
jgi:hypothetical protein